MKHPVLTRLMSIALAILSLIMLLAGALGIPAAREDNQDTLASFDRLQGRIEEYETVTQALEGTISYEEANKALQELQDQHDSDASQHKSDLAMYTATKGGVSTGVEAIEQGEEAIAQAWAAYDQGLAALLEGEEQLKALQAGKDALKGLIGQSETVNADLDKVTETSQNLSDFPEIPDPLPGMPGIPQLSAQSGRANGPLVASTLAAVTPPDEPQSGEDEDNSGGGTDPSGGIGSEGETDPNDGGTTGDGDNTGGGGGTGNEETGSGEGETAPKTIDRSDIEQAFRSLDGAYGALETFAGHTKDLLENVSQMDGLPEEQKAMIAQAMAGMQGADAISLARQGIQQTIDGVETALPAQIPEAMMSVVELFRSTYDDFVNGYYDAVRNLTLFEPMLAGMEPMLQSSLQSLEEIEAQLPIDLDGIAAAKEQLAQARAAIEAGDAQLYSGWAQLQDTLNDLNEQAGDLEQEKADLEQEAAELEAKEEEVRQQKDLEKRQTSLKVLLLDRDGIQERVDGGMELLDSARDYGQQLLQDAEQEYKTRFAACLLMILGGLAGLAGIPAAFEKLKSRALLLCPAVLCLICAAGAEYIFEAMGRGSSYSAIAAGIFALLYLLAALPKVKKPGQAQ